MSGFKYAMAAAIVAGSVTLMADRAAAVGCLSGGAAGAVVGHVAGHHAVLGAAGGCIAGHEMKKSQERQAAQANPPPHN